MELGLLRWNRVDCLGSVCLSGCRWDLTSKGSALLLLGEFGSKEVSLTSPGVGSWYFGLDWACQLSASCGNKSVEVSVCCRYKRTAARSLSSVF